MLIALQPIMKSALQGLAIFFGMQFFMGKVFPQKPAVVTTTGEAGEVIKVPANNLDIPPFEARPNSLNEGANYNPIPQRIVPMWPTNSPLDVIIVISPTFALEPLEKVQKDRIILEEKGFGFGNYKEKRTVDTTFKVPKEVQNNGTLWGHFYIGLAGSKLDPSVHGFDPARAYHFAHPFTQYIAQKKVKKTKNLLAAKKAEEEEEVRQLILNAGGVLTKCRKLKRSQLDQSSTPTTIPTSQYNSSLTLENLATPVYIPQPVNMSRWKQLVLEMPRDRMDGITHFSTSTHSGNSRPT